MAEIKSTMEMVLERAARMASESSAQPDSEELSKQGMRLAASFLQDNNIDLAGKLAALPEDEKTHHLQGVALTLLRNIVLPREDNQLENSRLAIQGLLQIGQNNPDIAARLQEMDAILGNYRQHREQLRGQLESQFAQQIEQMEATLARQTGSHMKLEPAQHPKFQEEWQRLKLELNTQYGKAVEQIKKVIGQMLMKP